MNVPEPLDMLSIRAGFVSREAHRTLDYMCEVGPTATLDEVEAVAKAYIARSTSKLTVYEELSFTRYALERSLQGFVQLDVLTRDGNKFTMTPMAIRHYVQAIAHGCNDEEYASAPTWVRAIIEGDTKHD